MNPPSLRWLKINWQDFTGVWPVLALFMVVSEVLLGYWLSRASTQSERIVAGALMTAIFLCFLGVTVLISRIERSPVRTEIKDLPEPVTPGKQMVPTKPETEPELIADSRGTFTLKKPPPDWIVKQLTAKEWLADLVAITDPSAIEAWVRSMFASIPDDRILMLKSPRHISVIPVTGLTRIDGRKQPTALETNVHTRLGIVPLERAVPPLYVERPLAQNFLQALASIQSVFSLVKLDRSMTEGGREILLAEFAQRVENAIVNGEPGRSATLRMAVMGIAGQLTDHLLLMNYGKVETNEDPALAHDRQVLVELVNSFRPVEVVDAQERRRELAQKADRLFDELMEQAGEKAFLAELRVVAARLTGKDMDDPRARDEAIRQLEPFKAFSKNIRMSEELTGALEEFWDALDRAKRGDAHDFKRDVAELVEDFLSSDVAGDEEPVDALTGRAGDTQVPQIVQSTGQQGGQAHQGS